MGLRQLLPPLPPRGRPLRGHGRARRDVQLHLHRGRGPWRRLGGGAGQGQLRRRGESTFIKRFLQLQKVSFPFAFETIFLGNVYFFVCTESIFFMATLTSLQNFTNWLYTNISLSLKENNHPAAGRRLGRRSWPHGEGRVRGLDLAVGPHWRQEQVAGLHYEVGI